MGHSGTRFTVVVWGPYLSVYIDMHGVEDMLRLSDR